MVLPISEKYAIMSLLHTDVNFVPTFLINGRSDSAVV